MPSRNWSDDDELILDVADALRPNPTEQQVMEAARAAYAWRSADPDRELAALLYDSHLDRTALGGADPRLPVRGQPSHGEHAAGIGQGGHRGQQRMPRLLRRRDGGGTAAP